MSPAEPLVTLAGITKRFGFVTACDDVSLELAAGEIHALLGENGAGKSTLMNVLSGLYRPESGTVTVGGRAHRFRHPREALAAGIGMVHQHHLLIPGMTVAENVLLGDPGLEPLLRPAAMRRRVADLAARSALDVDPGETVGRLSLGERQRVEILKLLARSARVLILDEPTAVLAPTEVTALMGALRAIADAGAAVVIISHRLEEVLAAADRVTVMRRGKVCSTVLPAETSAAALASLMVGEPTDGGAVRPPPAPSHSRGPVLVLENCRVDSPSGRGGLENLSLTIESGEILGLVGVAGNGQAELVEIVTGLGRPRQGRVLVNGLDLTGRTPYHFRLAGVGHIPEDRLGMGIVGAMTVAENLALLGGDEPHDMAAAASRIAEFGIRPADPRQPAGILSGGNIQRLILARELAAAPLLLVAASPFQGLDVAAVDFLSRRLREAAGGGVGILLVGEDVDLTLRVSHRVGVLSRGLLLGLGPADGARAGELGLLMAGASLREGRP